MENIELYCTIVGAIAIILGGVWFIIKQAFKKGADTTRFVEVEKKVGKLQCQNHHDDLTTIKAILIQKYPGAANLFSMKASPRQLNSLGKQLMKEMDGQSFLDKNKDTFFKYIKDAGTLTALDVEQNSYNALMFYTNTLMFNDLKDYVYNRASIDKADGGKYDVTLNDVCYVLGIPLRDMYLKENKPLGGKAK